MFILPKSLRWPAFYFFIALTALISLLNPNPAFSFGGTTHKEIAQAAIDLYDNQEMVKYKKDIIKWSEQADYWNFNETTHTWNPDLTTTGIISARDHFWNPDNDNTLPYVLAIPAIDKIGTYWNLACEFYKSGKKTEAYQTLGFITHFLSDMASPAHVHLDIHALSKDTLEEYVEKNIKKYKNQWFKNAKCIAIFDSLDEYMFNLAQRTQFFPSVGLNTKEEDGFKGNEVVTDTRGIEFIINPGYDDDSYGWTEYSIHDLKESSFIRNKIGGILPPLAASYVAGLYHLFYKKVNKKTFITFNQTWAGPIKNPKNLTSKNSGVGHGDREGVYNGSCTAKKITFTSSDPWFFAKGWIGELSLDMKGEVFGKLGEKLTGMIFIDGEFSCGTTIRVSGPVTIDKNGTLKSNKLNGSLGGIPGIVSGSIEIVK